MQIPEALYRLRSDKARISKMPRLLSKRMAVGVFFTRMKKEEPSLWISPPSLLR